MRLVTYDIDRGPRAGVLRDGTIVDAWDALGRPPAGSVPSVRTLLSSGRVEELAAAIDSGGSGAVASRADLRLLAPVPDPDKLVGIGLNYASHAAEAGLEPPTA